MADYFPLIMRAVAGLAPNTREARETIYARARQALTRQLTSIEPPIPDADLWRERNALEETIRRVEAQYPQPAPPVTTVRPVAPPPPPAPPGADAVAAPVRASLPTRSAAAAPPAPARPPEDEDDTPARTPVIVDSTDVDASPPTPADASRRPKLEADRSRAFGGTRATAITIALPAMVALGVAAYVMRDDPAAFERREVVAPSAETGGPARKNEGRLDGSAPAAPAVGPRPAPPPQAVQALPVAARAVFFEETANDPRGTQSDGQVIWRLETVARGPGLPPQTAVRGSANFPAANMGLEIVINPNRDSTLPASHTVEVVFRPENGRPGVTEIGPIEAREQEAQPGYQLRGVMVPIASNLFLVGLENQQTTIERNIEAMREQRFFAFQFRMSNGRVGALLLEKGPTGDRVFREAIDAWAR